MATLLMLLGAQFSIFFGLILFAWSRGQICRAASQSLRALVLSIGLTNAALIVSSI